jgi:hypothetical protein
VSDNYWKDIVATRTGVINPNVPGSYNLQYNAVDGSGNVAATYYAVVVVKDLIAPQVTLLGANPLTVDVFTTFNDPGVNASDNYYPNVTTVRTGLPTMNTLGTFIVTYTVTDGEGNSTVVTRTVNVVDRKAPTIQLLGKNPLKVARFSKQLEDPGVKLLDNYYSDAALRGNLITNSAAVDLTIPGYYFITYNLVDPSGNRAIPQERLIEVVESTTGIYELNPNQAITMYPNPNNGVFTIGASNGTNIAHIKVVDILGKNILEQDVQKTEATVNMATAGKGLYLVFIEDAEGNVYTQKLVIE